MRTNKLSGFSLAEALMTLLLIAVVAVMSAPFLLKKVEKKKYEQHGMWECKLSGGSHTITKRNKEGKIISGPKNTGSSCTFEPPAGASDFHIDICGGDPYTQCQEDDGSHVVLIYPALSKVKNIRIGADLVEFGNYAFAYSKGTTGRVLIVY